MGITSAGHFCCISRTLPFRCSRNYFHSRRGTLSLSDSDIRAFERPAGRRLPTRPSEERAVPGGPPGWADLTWPQDADVVPRFRSSSQNRLERKTLALKLLKWSKMFIPEDDIVTRGEHSQLLRWKSPFPFAFPGLLLKLWSNRQRF